MEAAYIPDMQPYNDVMVARSRTKAEPLCSIERALGLVGDRWTFLVLRDSLIFHRTRFAEFEDALGIAPTVLTNRLEGLVDAGLLEKRPYQEEGSRSRFSYHPTTAGGELMTVLLALQQWGDHHVAPRGGPTSLRRTARGDRPVSVGFLDDRGRSVPLSAVAVVERRRAGIRAKRAAGSGKKVLST